MRTTGAGSGLLLVARRRCCRTNKYKQSMPVRATVGTVSDGRSWLAVRRRAAVWRTVRVHVSSWRVMGVWCADWLRPHVCVRVCLAGGTATASKRRAAAAQVLARLLHARNCSDASCSVQVGLMAACVRDCSDTDTGLPFFLPDMRVHKAAHRSAESQRICRRPRSFPGVYASHTAPVLLSALLAHDVFRGAEGRTTGARAAGASRGLQAQRHSPDVPDVHPGVRTLAQRVRVLQCTLTQAPWPTSVRAWPQAHHSAAHDRVCPGSGTRKGTRAAWRVDATGGRPRA